MKSVQVIFELNAQMVMMAVKMKFQVSGQAKPFRKYQGLRPGKTFQKAFLFLPAEK